MIIKIVSTNEPSMNFRTYYYQSTSVANQTAAANWECAGDQGNKLSKTYMIKLFDIPDAALVDSVYYNFYDLRSALVASPVYATVNAASTWLDVKAALIEVGDTIPDGEPTRGTHGIYGQMHKILQSGRDRFPMSSSTSLLC